MGYKVKQAAIGCLIFLTGIMSFVPVLSSAADKTDRAADIRVKSIEIKGNTFFSDLRLKLRMKLWGASVFPWNDIEVNEKWLKRDIKNFVAFYRNKGFADVSVTPEIITRESGFPGLNRKKYKILRINIKEGLKYSLVFKGNTFFSSGTLKKAIKIFERGNSNDVFLRKGRADIKKQYKRSGFNQVSAAFKKDQIKKDGQILCEVVYTIKEGRRMVVAGLEITGNENLKTPEIKEAMLTREKSFLGDKGFTPSVLEQDVSAIELVYLSRGYLNAKVKTRTRIEPDSAETASPYPVDRVYVDLSIHEGKQTLVSSNAVTGLSGLVSAEKALAQVTLTPEAPFRPHMVKSDANALAVFISEMGYPHVKVDGRYELDKSETRARIFWDVNPGPFTRVGKISCSGNFRLKQAIIDKQLNIKSDDVFSLREILAAEKRIRSIRAVDSAVIKAPGLIEKINVPGVKDKINGPALTEKVSRIDLVVDVKEKKPYYVEAAAGYDTERLLYVKAEAGDCNFMGRNIDAWAFGEISRIGFRTETGIQNPFFLDRDVLLKSTLFAEKEEALNQDFGVKSWGASVGFSKSMFDRFKAGLNFKYENRERYGNGFDTYTSWFDDREFKARNLLITSASLIYDNRDSVVHPGNGFFSSASIDLYSGFENDLDRFLKYRLDMRQFFSPFATITFAFLTRIGHIQPLGSSGSVAEDQLFFLGGISDVRGFKENMLTYDAAHDPLGGLTSVCASLESRIDMPAGFELTIFVDTGRIGHTLSDPESNAFRSSAGLGLRYKTPLGPVGLLYGHKLNPESEESPGRFHFTIGYTF